MSVSHQLKHLSANVFNKLVMLHIRVIKIHKKYPLGIGARRTGEGKEGEMSKYIREKKGRKRMRFGDLHCGFPFRLKRKKQ